MLPSEAELLAAAGAAAEDEARLFSTMQTVAMAVGLSCGIVLMILLNSAVWRYVRRKVKSGRWNGPRIVPVDTLEGRLETLGKLEAQQEAAPGGAKGGESTSSSNDTQRVPRVSKELMGGKLKGVRGKAQGYMVEHVNGGGDTVRGSNPGDATDHTLDSNPGWTNAMCLPATLASMLLPTSAAKSSLSRTLTQLRSTCAVLLACMR